MNNAPIPYDDIAGYIRQEISDDKRHEVEAWINDSPENRKLFEQLFNEWENIYDTPEESVRADKKKVWTGISSHIEASLPVKSYTRQFLVKVSSSAAMIAVIIGITVAFFVKSSIDSAFMTRSITTVETSEGQKMQMTLPDGTRVWLNSGSKLLYAADFNSKNRIVKLEGEGFFRVTKNENKKFIVKTSSVDIIVKGTSFDVSAYHDDREIRISLLEGEVAISDKEGNRISGLHPNELAVISRENLGCTVYKKEDAEIYRAWTHDQLTFYNADTHEIIKKFERWYGIHITWIDPDEKQKYTFSVKTESLHEVLELFNKLTPIDYTVNGKEVTIVYK